MTITIAAVIPTRNRASYAIAAIQSLLSQDAGLDIFVSDNSTDAAPLSDFCSTEPRVRYLRPSAELAMPQHWDWAIRQAMELSSASHFTVHYDRRISKPGIWKDLAAAESKTPDLVMTFPLDAIAHEPPPLRLWQTPWTGKTFSVSTARVARLLADGKVIILSNVLPVLSNCIVPRAVLDSIAERFGSVCNSNAPDTAFLARFLALYDRYIHFDRATGILYGSTRSNGLGYLRNAGGDFGDYRKLWGGRAWLAAAPFPGINLGSNILFNEYEIVRRETGDRLPPLDRAGVLDDLSSQLPLIADPQMKADLHRMLREHGWNGPDPAPFPDRPWSSSARQAISMFLMRWFGFKPPSVSGFAFANDAAALRCALQYPSAAQKNADHLAILEAEALV
ncbi:MAG TPA: glycosyltransferase family 2 protein [Thermoanaerobaculia bacterium]|jgi:glycosyltransferase involved in cell wall biosynthesis|nr:glycosyltransferase family 2 protein [Thermoanaerobaculia bacterium]